MVPCNQMRLLKLQCVTLEEVIELYTLHQSPTERYCTQCKVHNFWTTFSSSHSLVPILKAHSGNALRADSPKGLSHCLSCLSPHPFFFKAKQPPLHFSSTQSPLLFTEWHHEQQEHFKVAYTARLSTLAHLCCVMFSGFWIPVASCVVLHWRSSDTWVCHSSGTSLGFLVSLWERAKTHRGESRHRNGWPRCT